MIEQVIIDEDDVDLQRYERQMSPSLSLADSEDLASIVEGISFVPDDLMAGSVASSVTCEITKNAQRRKRRLIQTCRALLSLLILSCFAFLVSVLRTLGLSGVRNMYREEVLGAVSIPENYRNFVDTNSKGVIKSGTIAAVVWDIPGDGDVLQHILSRCLGLVAAGGAPNNKRQTWALDEPLEIFQNEHGRFVNCYAGNERGISRINRTNLVESGLADVIYAPMIYEIAPSFTDANPAKMVAMFHDPVQRVASVYYIVKKLIPQFKNKTIEEFLKTKLGELNNNWMTRELANCSPLELNDKCLLIAKEIVRKKCVVGLTSDLDRSLENIYDEMGWKSKRDGFEECSSELKNGVGLDRLYTDLVAHGSIEYELIASYNRYDIDLFKEAKSVYEQRL